MASDGPSPHSSSLHLGLTASQPSRRPHAQSLLNSSFHDQRTFHVLEAQTLCTPSQLQRVTIIGGPTVRNTHAGLDEHVDQCMRHEDVVKKLL